MLQKTQRFIEEYIDDIELNRWKELHTQLHQVSELKVHIDFIKTMLEAGLTSVTPGYSLEQLHSDIDIIAAIEFKDFSEPARSGNDVYLFLTNDVIATALSNILKATGYFNLTDNIDIHQKDPIHNFSVCLENAYKNIESHSYVYAKTKCYVMVNLETRVTNLSSAESPMWFDLNRNNPTGDIQFLVNQLFESNVYRAIVLWLSWYILAE